MEFIQKNLAEKNLTLSSHHFTTVRQVEFELLRRKGISASEIDNLRIIDAERAACAVGGLSMEEAVHVNATPKMILKGLKGMKPGVYRIRTPVSSLFSNTVATYHSALLIKESDHRYYLYDPNFGLGESEDGEALLGRFYATYGQSLPESLMQECDVFKLVTAKFAKNARE